MQAYTSTFGEVLAKSVVITASVGDQGRGGWQGADISRALQRKRTWPSESSGTRLFLAYRR
jgi:hypothetical protein